MKLNSNEPIFVVKLKNRQTKIQNEKTKICTFTYNDWQVSTGTYTDELTAVKSL